MAIKNQEIISKLRKDILRMQGFKPRQEVKTIFRGLRNLESSFPNAVFPTGTLHEFLTSDAEQAASTGGFITGLLHSLMNSQDVCLWISRDNTVFAPALTGFGIKPDHVIFIQVNREQDELWVMEEALKCKGLAAVIAEITNISFTQSRRLQLVVEQSSVTGFLIRRDTKKLSTTASAARWRIRPAPSLPVDGLPGLGFPRWHVELLRVKNGNPGSWDIEWSPGGFNMEPMVTADHIPEVQELRTG